MLDGEIVPKIHNKPLARLLGKWSQFFLTLTASGVVEKTLEVVTTDVVILVARLSSSLYSVVPIVCAQVQW